MAVTFTKEVSLGNALSALTMVVTATVFILSIRSSSQLEMTELRGEMKVYASRVDQLNKDFQDFKIGAQQSNSEIRQTLNSVSTSIADMRVLIAGSKGGERR